MKPVFWIIVVAVLASCSNRDSTSEILPKPKMMKLLWDMIQVDEFSGMYIITDTSKNLKNERMKLYKQVFHLHNVSEKEFFSSYKYYSTHPVEMKEIFDSLNIRAERAKVELNTRKDSLP